MNKIILSILILIAATISTTAQSTIYKSKVNTTNEGVVVILATPPEVNIGIECNNKTCTMNEENNKSEILRYNWDFGDGKTSTEKSTSNTYSSNGTYNVCLTTTNQRDLSTTECNKVVISDISVNCLNRACSFSPSNTSDILSLNWDLGDSNTQSSSSFTHTYAADGNYNVCLDIQSTSNIISKSCTSVNVIEQLTVNHGSFYVNGGGNGYANYSLTQKNICVTQPSTLTVTFQNQSENCCDSLTIRNVKYAGGGTLIRTFPLNTGCTLFNFGFYNDSSVITSPNRAYVMSVISSPN